MPPVEVEVNFVPVPGSVTDDIPNAMLRLVSILLAFMLPHEAVSIVRVFMLMAPLVCSLAAAEAVLLAGCIKLL